MIYFITGNVDNAPIKVGFTENKKTLKTRIASLQTGFPWEIVLLGTITGDLETERCIHQLLSDYNINGEWFEHNGIVSKFVERAIKHGLPRAKAGMAEIQPVKSHVTTLIRDGVEVVCEKISNRFLTIYDACKYTGLSRRTLDRHKDNGYVPYIKHGKRVLFDVNDLDAWMLQYKVDVVEDIRRMEKNMLDHH